MKNINEMTNEWYEENDCVFFRNELQAAYYKSWGARLVDFFVDVNMKWVWVFTKTDHDKFKIRWKFQKEHTENERRKKV